VTERRRNIAFFSVGNVALPQHNAGGPAGKSHDKVSDLDRDFHRLDDRRMRARDLGRRHVVGCRSALERDWSVRWALDREQYVGDPANSRGQVCRRKLYLDDTLRAAFDMIEAKLLVLKWMPKFDQGMVRPSTQLADQIADGHRLGCFAGGFTHGAYSLPYPPSNSRRRSLLRQPEKARRSAGRLCVMLVLGCGRIPNPNHSLPGRWQLQPAQICRRV